MQPMKTSSATTGNNLPRTYFALCREDDFKNLVAHAVQHVSTPTLLLGLLKKLKSVTHSHFLHSGYRCIACQV